MKIFAAAGAYRAAPSSDAFPGLRAAPFWYEIPDSCISRSGNPFFVPDSGSEYMAFPSAAFRICRLGKNIATRFAPRYYDEATLGFSVVALDTLRALRAERLPWTHAVAFDRSCLLGDFIPADQFRRIAEFSISCGDFSSSYSPAESAIDIDSVIALISADNTLKTGDIILASLSPAGIPLSPRARLSVNAGGLTLFDINVK